MLDKVFSSCHPSTCRQKSRGTACPRSVGIVLCRDHLLGTSYPGCRGPLLLARSFQGAALAFAVMGVGVGLWKEAGICENSRGYECWVPGRQRNAGMIRLGYGNASAQESVAATDSQSQGSPRLCERRRRRDTPSASVRLWNATASGGALTPEQLARGPVGRGAVPASWRPRTPVPWPLLVGGGPTLVSGVFCL